MKKESFHINSRHRHSCESELQLANKMQYFTYLIIFKIFIFDGQQS